MTVHPLRWANLAAIAGALGISVLMLPDMPDVMVTHWNAYGQADGFGPKGLALFMVPGVMAALVLLFSLLPRLSPRGYELDTFRDTSEAMLLAVLIFLLAVHGMVIAAGLGEPIAIERAIPFAVSLLFAALGALLGKVPPNFFIGVRTPWTLTSPDVWRATHRFTSRLFVLGGLALAVMCLAGVSFWAVFVGFAALGVAPIAHSLVTWLKWGPHPSR